MPSWKEVVNMSPEEKKKVKYDDERLDEFAHLVEERYKIPFGLLVSIKNGGERTNTGQVSRKGAKGVMQFMDNTRKDFPHDVNDPLASIDASGKYIKQLLDQNQGDVRKALLAYNWGPGNLKKKGEEQAPFEAELYANNVINYAVNRWGNEPPPVKPEIKSADAYKDDELAVMPHIDLMKVRELTKDKEQQNRAAKYEHRAFTREETYRNPAMIPSLLLGTPLDTAAKALGLREGRSDASFEQIEAGWEGIIDGIKKRMREGRAEADKVKAATTMKQEK